MKYETDTALYARRLTAVAEDAERCPKCVGGEKWYRRKYRWLQSLAATYGVDFDALVAAYANLSANATVEANDRFVVDVLEGRKPGTFGHPIRRAHMALSGRIAESLRFKNAAKVSSFAENIRHPWTSGAVTIDRHAADILTNDRSASKSILAWAGLRGYRILESVYRDVADTLGMRPHELQAHVWVHWVDCMSRDERNGLA